MPPIAEALAGAPPERLLEVGAKALAYLGVLYAAGAFLFLALFRETDPAIADRSMRRAVLWAAIAVGATALLVPLRAAFLGGDWSMAADPMLMDMVARSPLGSSLAWRAAGATILTLGAILALLGLRAGVWLGAAGGAVALAGLTLIGHSAMLAPPLLWRAVLTAHLLVAAFWLGALAPLQHVARGMPAATALPLLERFGRIAAIALAALAAAGAALSWTLLGGDLSAGLDTAYGGFLGVKLGIVGLLLLLAAWHKWRLTPDAAAGGPQAARLARSIGRERWIAAGVVVATAALTTLSAPPRVL